MRITHVGEHCCIRMTKCFTAEKALGHEVRGIGFNPPWDWGTLDVFLHVHHPEHLTKAVQETDHRTDVYHVHNTPDWLVPYVRKGTDKPIIFDVHDPEVLQWGHTTQDEAEAYAACDGVVHVSEPCRDLSAKYYPHGKPTVVLPSYVNEKWMPDLPLEVSFQSIVYEGGIGLSEKLQDPYTRALIPNYKFLPPVINQLYDAGYRLHVYTGSHVPDTVRTDYMASGAVMCGRLPYGVMLAALRSYGLGWFGTEFPNEKYHSAEPNKLYEYLSQGVVPVVYRSRNSERWVERTGLGIVLDSISDLPERAKEAPAIRTRILAERKSLAMERQIGPLLELYGRAIAQRSAS